MFNFWALYKSIGLKNFVTKGLIYSYRKAGLQKYFTKYYSYNDSPGDQFANVYPEWENIPFLNTQSLNTVSDFLNSLDEQTKKELITECDDVLSGKYSLFSNDKITLGAPDFNKNPFDNISWEVGKHSSDFFQFNPEYGDIKRVWELNRLQFLDPLLCGYVLGDNERKIKIREFFIDVFSEWLKQSPHERSVAWACSQEISIRCIKLIILFRYLDISTSNVYTLFRNLLVHCARHVGREITYAKAQRNNHAITESAYLILFGLLFKNSDIANQYYSKGIATLEHCLGDQFYEDGTYIQNSITYQRFALQSLVLVNSSIDDSKLKVGINEVFKQNLIFLYNITFGKSGDFPNYGPNDGAMLYNWSGADYRDIRPLLNTLSGIVENKAVIADGRLMLDGVICTGNKNWTGALFIPAKKTTYDVSGYYLLKNDLFDIFFRCGSYKGRFPSQNDMMHVDIWYKKMPCLIDSGTFEYFGNNGVKDFHKFLATDAHNTVKIGNLDQLDKGPRFTWESSINAHADKIEKNYISGESFAYLKRLPGNPVHKRSIKLLDSSIVIEDEISGAHNLLVELFWHTTEIDDILKSNGCYLLNDAGLTVKVSSDQDFIDEVFEYCHSRYYAQKQKAKGLKYSFKASKDKVSLTSTFSVVNKG